MRKLMFTAVVVAVFAVTAGVVTGSAHAKASPATTYSFSPAGCSATFVKSSSGLIIETNRSGCPTVDGYAPKIVFRPLSGPPNPACDPDGLLTQISSWQFHDASADAGLVDLFGGTYYRVCFYLPEGTTFTGSVDSGSMSGTTQDLPAWGTYRIDVSGTWQNGSNPGNRFDAEYYTPNNWVDWYDGVSWNPAGANQGDLMVDGGFVDWGAYNASHDYSLTGSFGGGGSVNLAVFDGTWTAADGYQKVSGYYNDNSGSLSYTITYVGS